MRLRLSTARAWRELAAHFPPIGAAVSRRRRAAKGRRTVRRAAFALAVPAAASLFAGAAAWLLLVQPNRTAPAPTPQATPAGPISVAFEALAPGERCMAQAIYFEARGESIEGQLAVAQVIVNRTRDPHYPSDICGVVFQGSHHRHACQFSFACDGRSDRPRNMAAWARAVRLAKIVRSGPIRDLTEDATHYHADYVTPTWATQLMQTVTIGRHHFYRDAAVN